MEKPIALSEMIMWARSLELCEVTRLDRSVIEATVSDLAKREKDRNKLLGSTNRLLRIIRKRYYQGTNNVVRIAA